MSDARDPSTLDDIPSAPVNAVALVSLLVHGAWIAIDAKYVSRVAEAARMTPLPRAPSHIPGLVLIGARAVPVMDLGDFLGLNRRRREEPADNDAPPRLVVCAAGAFKVAIPCAAVRVEHEIAVSLLTPPQVSRGDVLGRYAVNELDTGTDVVTVVDLPTVLEAARVKR